jgi:hypothetical protein
VTKEAGATPVRHVLKLAFATLAALGGWHDSVNAQSQSQTRITGTAFRRSPSKDFIPERSFIVNRGSQLHSYQLRFRFEPAARTAVEFQNFACTAKTSDGKTFSFAFRNQTVPANRTESDPYFLIVPVADVAAAACVLGTKPPSADSFRSTRT